LDDILVSFIKALRGSHVRVSHSESIDAAQALSIVGYNDRALLKNALAACLSKSELEKTYFDLCFERFFTVQRMSDISLKNASITDASKQSVGEQPDQLTEFQLESDNKGDNDQGNFNVAQNTAQNETQTNTNTVQSALGKMLLSGDSASFALSLNNAANEVDINSIRSFTQRGLFGRRIMLNMGLAELEAEIRLKKNSEITEDRESARKLIQAREVLRAEVRDYVERQLVLYTATQGEQFKEDMIKNMPLNNMELRTFSELDVIVRKMAQRLLAVHSRRRRIDKRGQLNIKKTLQSNMAYNGNLFRLKWKSTKLDRPRVMVICDVSGSVAEVSRFLLMFLYSLNELLPNVRSFAFSSCLGEVSEQFKNLELSEAIQTILNDWGKGSTDYGESILNFKDLTYSDIDHRTTILILGDARNNYREHQSQAFKAISERAKQIIWLNPEQTIKWSRGDSVMKHYQPYCQITETCNTLNHLERIVDKLLKRTH